MEIRNRQQNLGFGMIHARINKTKLSDEGLKVVQLIQDGAQFPKVITGDGVNNKIVNHYNYPKKTEQLLVKILKAFGIKAYRTEKPGRTRDIARLNDIKWLFKA